MSRLRSSPKLYAIADWDFAARAWGASVDRYCALVDELLGQGVGWIQIRAKSLGGAELYRLVERVVASGTRSGRFWLNDRADIAALLPVTGVHLGQDDLAPAAVREVLGEDRLIGLSTHTPDQVRAADQDPDVDLVAFGPIFETRNKNGAEPSVGLSLLESVRLLTSKPLVAIGGLDARTAGAAFEAGADTVAAIAGFCSPGRRIQDVVWRSS